MKYNIIGAGRLGKNIAKVLAKNKQLALNSICNRTLESGQQACAELGFGTPVSQITDLPYADLTWITCNDDSIDAVVTMLINHSVIKPESLVIHCSGALSSAILLPLHATGCSIASIHPLKAFRAGFIDSEAFNGVDCILEGDKDACDWLKSSFSTLGANVISIKPEAKAAYHAAACMASNYLITLASASEELLTKAGLTAGQRHKMICHLMQNTLNNLKHTPDIAQALTGPLMRGDANTLNLHLQAIDNPVIKKLYQTAGLATLPLTELSSDKYQMIKEILSK